MKSPRLSITTSYSSTTATLTTLGSDPELVVLSFTSIMPLFHALCLWSQCLSILWNKMNVTLGDRMKTNRISNSSYLNKLPDLLRAEKSVICQKDRSIRDLIYREFMYIYIGNGQSYIIKEKKSVQHLNILKPYWAKTMFRS